MVKPADNRVITRWLRVFLIGICTVHFSQTNAQPVNLTDSLSALLSTQPKPLLKMDSRNSFVTGIPVSLLGVKAGVQFSNRLELGLGYQWLKSQHTRVVTPSGSNDEEKKQAELKFRYFVVYGEYTFFSAENWTITVPVQVGVGNSFLLLDDGKYKGLKLKKGGVLLYEPAMLTDFHFLRYFSVGGGVGFRLMLINNKALSDRFTSPNYILRFRINFGKLWRDLKPD